MENQFKYQHSQILQFVYEASKEGKLDQLQKIKIKELIFAKDYQIQKFYENFEKTKNSDKFIKDLKKYISQIEDEEEEEDSDEEELKVSNEVLNNVESSPNDYLMYMKKRRNQHGHIKRSDEDYIPKQPEVFGTSVKACEEGMSPKINFRDYDDSD